MRKAGKKGRVIAVDGAKKIGAKILVAGGGRCNVTHHAVDEMQYAGTSLPAIRKVLGRYPVEKTIGFFAEQGVTLKREETGKLFPTTDDAQTVLDAIMRAAKEAGVQIVHPWRVATVAKRDDGRFVVQREVSDGQGEQRVVAKRVVLATGGLALPRTGSDGAGYGFARAMGHTLTASVFPSLVPLLIEKGHWVTGLSGVSVRATLRVHVPRQSIAIEKPATWQAGLAGSKVLASFTNSVLLTHFGLSGPAALDVSRYWTMAQEQTPRGVLVVNWLGEASEAMIDEMFAKAGRVALRRVLIAQGLPERLASELVLRCGLNAESTGQGLTREQRVSLTRMVASCVLPVVGDRGFTFAEVTAGGVPLTQVRLETMESRVCEGLHLCGELLDVDGRVGGFNFQWAWASGFVAGEGAGGQAEK
jgi:predicted Rossmann fold flavoprotein